MDSDGMIDLLLSQPLSRHVPAVTGTLPRPVPSSVRAFAETFEQFHLFTEQQRPNNGWDDRPIVLLVHRQEQRH